MECASCAAGLDHCHGTLVVHPDGGFAECTEARCIGDDLSRHPLTVVCSAFAGGCGCALAGAGVAKVELRKAS